MYKALPVLSNNSLYYCCSRMKKSPKAFAPKKYLLQNIGTNAVIMKTAVIIFLEQHYNKIKSSRFCYTIAAVFFMI